MLQRLLRGLLMRNHKCEPYPVSRIVQPLHRLRLSFARGCECYQLYRCANRCVHIEVLVTSLFSSMLFCSWSTIRAFFLSILLLPVRPSDMTRFRYKGPNIDSSSCCTGFPGALPNSAQHAATSFIFDEVPKLTHGIIPL